MSRTRSKTRNREDRDPLSPPLQVEGSVLLRDQRITPVPNLSAIGNESQSVEKFSMEFQMTVRSRVERITRKQASILLMVTVCEVIYKGIDLANYLTLEYLYSYLLGSSQASDLREEKERKTAMLAELLLIYTRGAWRNLSEVEQVPEEIKRQIENTRWLPNKQTIASWVTYYRPSAWLEIKIVRLDALMEHPTNTEPYSGYTKGYGNGGHAQPRKKTRYDYELDGEQEDRPPTEIPLWELNDYITVLTLIESKKAQRIQRRE